MACSGSYSDKASAFLESCLIHARVLKDFLYGSSSRYSDDVFAWEYVGSKEKWDRRRPTLGCYLVLNETRLNKCLAHLSITRLCYDGETKMWDLARVRDELGAAWEAFLKALPVERRDWFSEDHLFVRPSSV